MGDPFHNKKSNNMEKPNKEAEGLKELYTLIEKAHEKAALLGLTSKKTTLHRMLGVIEFDLFKLGETLPEE